MGIDPSLPLVDLHRHIEGSIRISTIVELVDKYNLPFPGHSLNEMLSHIQVTSQQPGVMAFIKKMELAIMVFKNYEICRRIAYECVEDAASEGIDYVELRFSPTFMAQPHSLNPFGVVEAMVDGIQSAKHDMNTQANIIGILSRTYGPETAKFELDSLLSQSKYLKAVDLAGDEFNFPGQLFTDHFNRVVDAGLFVTIHAGESSGPDSIWQALKQLHAQRIGHAVHALQDPTLLDYLREHRIPIESNLTSNVQTATVSRYSDHPIKKFLQHGIMATINSDDPAISGISLTYEYQHAARFAGLSSEEIRKVQINGLEAAFLTNVEKQMLYQKKVSQKQT